MDSQAPLLHNPRHPLLSWLPAPTHHTQTHRLVPKTQRPPYRSPVTPFDTSLGFTKLPACTHTKPLKFLSTQYSLLSPISVRYPADSASAQTCRITFYPTTSSPTDHLSIPTFEMGSTECSWSSKRETGLSCSHSAHGSGPVVSNLGQHKCVIQRLFKKIIVTDAIIKRLGSLGSVSYKAMNMNNEKIRLPVFSCWCKQIFFIKCIFRVR